jgi:hypothetical protein
VRLIATTPANHPSMIDPSRLRLGRIVQKTRLRTFVLVLQPHISNKIGTVCMLLSGAIRSKGNTQSVFFSFVTASLSVFYL